MLNGAPDVQLKMPPSCQPSTTRATHPGELPSRERPGPNGNVQVPFERRSYLRFVPSKVLFNCRFRGSILPAAPSDLLHVNVVWSVKPIESRFVTPACSE